MLRRKLHNSGGFTVGELMVTIVLVSGVLLTFSMFFADNFQGYLNLQTSTVRSNEISSALQRMTRVLRGIQSISDAQSNTLTGYAFFTPRDSTLSKVRYFYESGSQNLKVGVIPASGSAPNYTYNVQDEQISTIASNISDGSAIFRYVNSDNEEAEFTADTYKDIRAIKIVLNGLAVSDRQSPVNLQTTFTLSNRKTNL